MSETKDEWTDLVELRYHTARLCELAPAQIKQIKQLSQSAVSETFKYPSDKDVVMLCYRGNNLVCMVMFHTKSPECHFEGEIAEVSSEEQVQKPTAIPYLYNFICGPKYRRFKPQVSLMYKFKNYIAQHIDEYDARRVNLDIEPSNERSKRFFVRNGFVFQRKWEAGRQKKLYECYSWFF
jgi:hypothetical protein